MGIMNTASGRVQVTRVDSGKKIPSVPGASEDDPLVGGLTETNYIYTISPLQGEQDAKAIVQVLYEIYFEQKFQNRKPGEPYEVKTTFNVTTEELRRLTRNATASSPIQTMADKIEKAGAQMGTGK